MRVVVVGAGIMGCSSALALAARGAEVVVLERAVPGAEASSAAGGILGAQVEAASHGGPGAAFEAALRARDAWPGFVAALEARTGLHVGYRKTGVLKIALHEDEARGFADVVTWQGAAKQRVEIVSDRAAREIEPELAPSVRSALWFPDDAQVDPRALLRALLAALAGARVELRAGATVRGLLVAGGVCRGVRTEEELAADAVVLAAGSWSSLIPDLPATLPAVRPVRGQMVLLEERPPRLRTIVFGPRGYVVPRGDGRVLCGSTMEQVGFRKEVTAGGVQAILSSALAAIPSLAGAELASTWASFRPHAETPMIGASPLPGLFLATGHHRNGILLAPETARAVSDAVLGA
jgi:glycine oxidase